MSATGATVTDWISPVSGSMVMVMSPSPARVIVAVASVTSTEVSSEPPSAPEPAPVVVSDPLSGEVVSGPTTVVGSGVTSCAIAGAATAIPASTSAEAAAM